jgi:hypothetical protein
MDTNYFSDKLEGTFDCLLAFSYCTTNNPPNNDFSLNGLNGFATITSLIPKIPKDK